ncbi:MAG: Protease HtpX-like protein [Candidatus Giovannonibacteria bacterium GW2011_GWC2_44_9]|uniref:Protease HtpX homolog n=3 Tax=Candidatus Giovannoniibacteriota TaxID=1752738 RepID=A0A0G1IYZ8_9BACT|nr:MAG: Protease HtpX-like protein [Candidatus Giovannonibacteria bacterium GW2011_GWB1_44_23]KKT64223.1 MAG: Protease HtpX-like protein [Candidatus Giovannonibacteria bacterium GW2011_GWA1_44_29]KKT82951.1 MAG: Protease HtpX-like protein [Candidatus Giovannonibacteria bacterium GW2011_GWC2_44_9]KKT91824.1 MAG: Protease HtpX-like protein [Parcubacteria group bacterium GW2011_GWC1_45_13]
MSTIYTYRDANIRKTWALFSVFLIVVIGLGWIFSQIYGSPGILFFAAFFSIFMSFISYWYSDKIVLAMTGARAIQKKDAPELYNIVENLTIAAGLPMPRIFLVADRAPNAFATGRDPEHAVIAVTSGILEILDRTELEGVLAHELSHIGNRDMLLSTVAVVLAGFMSLLADFFMRSMLWGRGRDDNREGGGFFILIGIALSILAPIATTLIQLAISRKREFLADASGALLTRYPEGLASALEKISKVSVPVSRATPTTAHLWFADPLKKKTARLFMTHPPVAERIKALREMNL